MPWKRRVSRRKATAQARSRFAAFQAAFSRRSAFETLEDRRLLAATVTVNSPLDTDARDGVLTLREAIEINNRTLLPATLTAGELAQVSGTPTDTDTDTIAFNISGGGVHTISPTTALPTITDPVIIDGYTQPGASANTLAVGNDATLLIELDGTTAGGVGLTITAGGSTVKGLVINRFGAIGGIRLLTTGGNTIQGNFLGLNPAGDAVSGNGAGLDVESANNLIGGTTPAARNVVLSGGSNPAILVGIFNSAAVGNTIQGNYIGTNAAGDTGYGSLRGIYVESDSNLIGGMAAGAGNVIAGGGGFSSITVQSASGNKIQGNLLGVSADGTVFLGNDLTGIDLLYTDSTIIGGDDDDDGTLDGVVRARNVIVSGGTGIRLFRFNVTGAGDLVQGNYIGTNAAGTAALVPGGGAGDGVFVYGSRNNRIGGVTPGAGNVIANYGSGIHLQSPGAATRKPRATLFKATSLVRTPRALPHCPIPPMA